MPSLPGGMGLAPQPQARRNVDDLGRHGAERSGAAQRTPLSVSTARSRSPRRVEVDGDEVRHAAADALALAQPRACSGRVGVHAARRWTGCGTGSVVIQWLTRNSGAVGRPAVGPAGRASPAGSVSCDGPAERERRLLEDRLVGRVVPGAAPARFSARNSTRWPLSIISRSVGQRPVVGPAVGELARGRRRGPRRRSPRARRVLVDDDEHLARVGDEELADVVEHRRERRGAELAERVAEVHAALALAGEAEPVADPQRRVDRLRADAVLRSAAAALAAELRCAAARWAAGPRSACRSAARGCRPRAAPAIGRVLRGGVPARAAAPTSSCASRPARPRSAAGRTAPRGRCTRRRAARRRSRRRSRRTPPTATAISAAASDRHDRRPRAAARGARRRGRRLGGP